MIVRTRVQVKGMHHEAALHTSLIARKDVLRRLSNR